MHPLISRISASWFLFAKISAIRGHKSVFESVSVRVHPRSKTFFDGMGIDTRDNISGIHRHMKTQFD